MTRLRVAVNDTRVTSINRRTGVGVNSANASLAWNQDPNLVAFANELPSFISLISSATIVNIESQVDRKLITYQKDGLSFYRTVYNNYTKDTDILYRDAGLTEVICRRNF